MNVRMGFEWVWALNLVDAVLVGLAILTLMSRRKPIREVATVAYLIVSIVGVFFVWTPHGRA